MKVNIHIDRVVLDGLNLPQHQQTAFQATVKEELARLFAKDQSVGRFIGGGSVPHIRTGQIDAIDPSDPVSLGKQVAGALYGGLRG